MSRSAGVRNADYQATRTELLGKLARALMADSTLSTSFRSMASSAGVSPATLRHYFAERETLLEAVLRHMRAMGSVHLSEAASRPIDDVTESLGWLLRSLVEGWGRGVGRIHALGLSAGLNDATLGPAYVNQILEPTLQAAEARIARHIAQGQLEQCDVRHAALELLSPVVMGLLHQDRLDGRSCRPLDLDAFLRDHLARFMRAYAPPRSSRR